METAMTYSDGLSVLGVFFQLGKSSNNALKRLCALLNLLPSDLSRYYTYSGSLTTPPCSECVTWIVLDEPVVMSIDQLETLREMHANCVSCGNTDNFRPICPVGSRSVRCSFRV
ncbi:unnamed protein product [Heterobilharzia americana]|nr:unnamed protein product [Heterobilharzia americana]